MGLKLEQLTSSLQNKNKVNSQQQFPQEKKYFQNDLLLHLFRTIQELPARSDLKKMLKKCIYGIFTNQKIEMEIDFLQEVRNYLSQVQEQDVYYKELLELLAQIYQLAIDRQLENASTPDQIKPLQVNLDLLNQFNPLNVYKNDEKEEDTLRVDQQQLQQYIQNIQTFDVRNLVQNPCQDIYMFSDCETQEYEIEDDLDIPEDNLEEVQEIDNTFDDNYSVSENEQQPQQQQQEEQQQQIQQQEIINNHESQIEQRHRLQTLRRNIQLYQEENKTDIIEEEEEEQIQYLQHANE